MTRDIISTGKAPQAIGPYSQALRAGGFVFVSGQIPLDPETGELSTAPIGEQTAMVLRALHHILEAAGTGLALVVQVRLYLVDMSDFAEVNRAYGEFFTDNPPARCAVEVAALPKGASIEVEAVALA